MLLINKFRHKFNINPAKEANLDTMIKDEVTNLLSSGSTFEKHLSSLDKKLTAIVAQERKNSRNSPSQSPAVATQVDNLRTSFREPLSAQVDSKREDVTRRSFHSLHHKSSMNDMASPLSKAYGAQSQFSRVGSSIVNVYNNGSVVADMGNHVI